MLKWLEALGIDSNEDEVSRFWSSTLQYLNAYVGYYHAIRSGDWNLRNACLPKLSELFFAFSHNKYEELVCQTLTDAITLPEWVLNQFLKGEWTASVNARPHHNLALDEAHECMINKRLKELTSCWGCSVRPVLAHEPY